MHPYIISKPLMIYSFLDIAIQIICQIPIYEGSILLEKFGFDRVFTVNKNLTFE